MRRHGLLCAVSLGFVIVAVGMAGGAENAAATPPVSYRPPEEFAGRIPDYIAHAKSFLERHPTSTVAPRAAMDLLMLAETQKNTALSEEALAPHLVFDHPTSFQTAYCLTTYGQTHGTYKTFLQKQLKQAEDKLPPGQDSALSGELAGKYCRAIDLGLRQWGPAFLSGDEFIVQAAMAAQEANAFRLGLMCREKLRECDADTQRIAEMAFDSSLTTVEKCVRLNEIDDNKSARFCQRYLMGSLTEQERASPEICKIRALQLLEDSKFADALPIIEGLLADSPSDQTLYWHGWCLGQQQGRTNEAAAAYERLLKEYPESPYRASSQELMDLCLNMDQNLKGQADVLTRLLAGLRAEGLDAVEMHLTWMPKDGEPKACFVALDIASGEKLEISVRNGAEMLLAYKMDGNRCRLFCQGDPVIHEYSQGIHVAPVFNIQQQPDKTFNFNFNANFQPKGGAMEHAVRNLLANPHLAGPGSMESILGHGFKGGHLPAHVRTDHGEQILAWTTPSATKPECQRLELRLNPDEHAALLTGSQFNCRLRYGTQSAFVSSPPSWPDLPVKAQAKMDGAVMFRLMAAAMSLWQKP